MSNKKTIVLLVCAAIAVSSFSSFSQTTLTKTMELKVGGTKGTRGANIAWHPVQKKYYAAMAGNIDYTLAVFSEKGNLLSDTALTTRFDVRGLWYNPTTKTLQANGYSDFGWAEYELDLKGIPSNVKTLFEGLYQPTEQSVGTYDYKNNNVFFFYDYDALVDYYSVETAELDSSLYLYSGCHNVNDAMIYYDADSNYFYFDSVIENYNSSTLVYTGIPDAEIGLLNVVDLSIELYSQKTGLLTRVLKLPSDAVAEASFNFSYTNGIYWLFNMSERKWVGYK